MTKLEEKTQALVELTAAAQELRRSSDEIDQAVERAEAQLQTVEIECPNCAAEGACGMSAVVLASQASLHSAVPGDRTQGWQLGFVRLEGAWRIFASRVEFQAGAVSQTVDRLIPGSVVLLLEAPLEVRAHALTAWDQLLRDLARTLRERAAEISALRSISRH